MVMEILDRDGVWKKGSIIKTFALSDMVRKAVNQRTLNTDIQINIEKLKNLIVNDQIRYSMNDSLDKGVVKINDPFNGEVIIETEDGCLKPIEYEKILFIDKKEMQKQNDEPVAEVKDKYTYIKNCFVLHGNDAREAKLKDEKERTVQKIKKFNKSFFSRRLFFADSKSNKFNTNASTTSVSARTSVSRSKSNILNADATGASASACASVSGSIANILNANINGVSAESALNATGTNILAANLNINAVSLPARLNIQASNVSVGNVSVSAASAGLMGNILKSHLAAFNVSFSGVSAEAGFSFSPSRKLRFCNISFGLGGFYFDLMPNLNFSFGGGSKGGGGGGKGGKKGKESCVGRGKKSPGIEGQLECSGGSVQNRKTNSLAADNKVEGSSGLFSEKQESESEKLKNEILQKRHENSKIGSIIKSSCVTPAESPEIRFFGEKLKHLISNYNQDFNMRSSENNRNNELGSSDSDTNNQEESQEPTKCKNHSSNVTCMKCLNGDEGRKIKKLGGSDSNIYGF